MAEEMKIPKIAVEAMIELHDRETLTGKFFLAPLTERHHGREQVLDLLTQTDPFLPFKLADGPTRLLAKCAVARVRIEKNFGMKELDPDGLIEKAGRLAPVMVCLDTGEVVAGCLPIMPEGSRVPRVLDWLRTSGEFLPLVQDEAILYISRQAITWIEEAPATPTA